MVHEVGTWEGRVFIAMEFVEGGTVGAWLAEKKRSWQEILTAFLQAACGLSAAHASGLVHRDFKPQNVMMGRDGTVRVMDFGLARRVGESPSVATDACDGSDRGALALTLTRTGERLGTPFYVAPEQFAGRKSDARTDQFSFCVALYAAMNGAHPFGGTTVAELAANVAAGHVLSPGRLPRQRV